MSLVGASDFVIKVPFIIGGGIQGFLGGSMAAAVLFVSVVFAKKYLNSLFFDFRIVPFLVGLGFFLGVLASFRSLPAEDSI
jgi:cell division protein FtsX